MTSEARVYPYCLDPQEKPAIWGGDALVSRYGKQADPAAAIGESWECWDANHVQNGRFAGTTLSELRAQLGADLMGTIDPDRMFPVLTKIIDARLALSVQVHPDDAYARRVEHQSNGKTECWYILDAQPGAELILGWSRDTDRAEFERRVGDGSLGEILRRVPVHAGQTYYLPAGTLHAIGAGIILFEAQQASDLTYRIFDWNRVGTDGRPRELHVAKAADVVDFSVTKRSATSSLSFVDGSLERTLLVADRHFTLERVHAVGPSALHTDGQPLTLTALGAPLTVRLDQIDVAIAPYATVVVPAIAGTVTVAGGGALVVRPDAHLDGLRSAAISGGVSLADADAFFEQFV